MRKIAVLGDRDSVLGFQALGLSVFPEEEAERARATLRRLVQDDRYAVLYLTEQLAVELRDELARYRDALTPAIIPIPGKRGSLGLGQAELSRAMERAVGADIL